GWAYMNSTKVVTPERIDSTHPCIAAACTSATVNSTAAGPVMQVNQSFSTMSSPGPFNRVWNRCVCVFTIPGMRILEPQSITSASGFLEVSSAFDPMPAIRSSRTRTLPPSCTSFALLTVTTQASARINDMCISPYECDL